MLRFNLARGILMFALALCFAAAYQLVPTSQRIQAAREPDPTVPADIERTQSAGDPSKPRTTGKNVLNTVATAKSQPSAPTRTNSPAGAALPISGTWVGQWKNDVGDRYSFVLQLDVKDSVAFGAFDWRLEVAVTKGLIERTGESIRQLLQGSFDEHTQELRLGARLVSNNTLIDADRYELQIAADGLSFGGRVRSKGLWRGSIGGDKARYAGSGRS